MCMEFKTSYLCWNVWYIQWEYANDKNFNENYRNGELSFVTTWATKNEVGSKPTCHRRQGGVNATATGEVESHHFTTPTGLGNNVSSYWLLSHDHSTWTSTSSGPHQNMTWQTLRSCEHRRIMRHVCPLTVKETSRDPGRRLSKLPGARERDDIPKHLLPGRFADHSVLIKFFFCFNKKI